MAHSPPKFPVDITISVVAALFSEGHEHLECPWLTSNFATYARPTLGGPSLKPTSLITSVMLLGWEDLARTAGCAGDF